MAKRRGKSKKATKSTVVVTEPQDVPIEVAKLNGRLQVCRLCEVADGPFLNIFDPGKVISKKIQELMPFVIAENDDLPHKICFRCSAKVEELHEFIEKCINTQKSLRITMEKMALSKTDSRSSDVNVWKDRLSKSRLKNIDICEEVIKKAMGYMQDMNSDDEIRSDSSNVIKDQTESSMMVNSSTNSKIKDTPQVDSSKKSKKSKVEPEKIEDTIVIDLIKDSEDDGFLHDRKITRSSRSNATEALITGNKTTKTPKHCVTNTKSKEPVASEEKVNDAKVIQTGDDMKSGTNEMLSTVPKIGQKLASIAVEINTKPTAVQSVTNKTEAAGSNEPKAFNIMDYVTIVRVHGVGALYQCKLCNRNFLKKEVVITHGCAKSGAPKETIIQKSPPPQPPKVSTVQYITTKPDKATTEKPPEVEIRTKPRIGPASRTRRMSCDVSSLHTYSSPVPGPSNNHTVVATDATVHRNTPKPVASKRKSIDQHQQDPLTNKKIKTITGQSEIPHTGTIKTRRSSIYKETLTKELSGNPESYADGKYIPTGTSMQKAQPYPVGLFQTVPRLPTATRRENSFDFPVFGSPATRKQLYTTVQPDNPNKILISSKPPVAPELNVISSLGNTLTRELKNAQKPMHIPVQKPSVDNSKNPQNIQEYSCNMCPEKFTREKKLQTHIQSHYKRMDEEDLLRSEKVTKKKGKK